MKVFHTPGPWGRNIPPASKYPVIYAGRNTHVASIISQGLFGSEVEANADLIAAAPDLLSALIALIEMPEYDLTAETSKIRREAKRQAKKAIARATGGTQ